MNNSTIKWLKDNPAKTGMMDVRIQPTAIVIRVKD